MNSVEAQRPLYEIKANLFKGLAHPLRIRVLEILAGDDEVPVTRMLEETGLEASHLSQHLAVLRHAKLVDYAQDGTLRCYYLSRPRLVKDLLALVERDDPVVKRTPAEIQADKERLARAQAANRASKSGREKAGKR